MRDVPTVEAAAAEPADPARLVASMPHTQEGGTRISAQHRRGPDRTKPDVWSSQDTALRDIDALMKRGVLAAAATGGRSTRYSLVVPAGGEGG